MTVDEFITELQRLNPDLRAKDIVITAPNGLQFQPRLVHHLIDPTITFGGIDNVERMVVTF